MIQKIEITPDIYFNFMKNLCDNVGSMPPEPINAYISESEKVLSGIRDNELMKEKTIMEIKRFKRDIQFFSDISREMIVIRSLIEKYLMDTGQLIKVANDDKVN